MDQQALWDRIIRESSTVETLEQGLAVFATVGMPARKLSERTRQAYQRDITDLIAFLTERGITRLEDVRLQDLENYQAELDRRGYAASTCRRKTFAIRKFFGFLYRHEHIATNITEQLIPPPRPKDEPRYLTETEYQRLLRACSHKPRDAAIIEVFLQTGMRLEELRRLTLDDIELPKTISKDEDNVGIARITRKGNKRAIVYLNYKACQALKTWLKVRPDVDHRALFVSKFKRPLSRRGLQYVIEKYLTEVGIEDASVHTLRHTWGTHHAAKGTPPRAMQENLGHASLATTGIYMAIVRREQREHLQKNAL